MAHTIQTITCQGNDHYITDLFANWVFYACSPGDCGILLYVIKQCLAVKDEAAKINLDGTLVALDNIIVNSELYIAFFSLIKQLAV